jgi:PAS domain S-box-containing protein
MSLSFSPDSNANSDLEFFQQLADGAPVMIWMSGTDMGCFYFNRAWLDYRGRTTEQEFGNGWAEGVHPDDLERCVKHYVSSFERRVAFAMSYRLQHHTGEYRWILDRGAPHFTPDGEFLGFYGGCAEIATDSSIPRVKELRDVLVQMREFASQLASTESQLLQQFSSPGQKLEDKAHRLTATHLSRKHAAQEIRRLADDMLTYDRIPTGACLQH